MTPLNAQTQNPNLVDYLDYFGLLDDPFSADLQPFYDGGARRELFAELLHLCQFSASVLVVLGEEGIGKGSLKAELSQHFAAQDKLIHFSVPFLCSEEMILNTVAVPLGIDVDDSSFKNADINQNIATIRQTIVDGNDDDSLKVVMIDNAHNLDVASLKILLRLSAPTEQNPYRQLHTVLFADSSFEQRVDQLDNKTLIQIFHLPALTPAEMKHYLRFRLDAVGFSGIFPFKDPDIQFLWDISKGVPGKFHDAAREILIELAMPPPETKSMGMPATHMAAVVVLLAGLLMVFFYQSGSNNDVGTDTTLAPPGGEPVQAFQQPNDVKPAVSDRIVPDSTELAVNSVAPPINTKPEIDRPTPLASKPQAVAQKPPATKDIDAKSTASNSLPSNSVASNSLSSKQESSKLESSKQESSKPASSKPVAPKPQPTPELTKTTVNPPNSSAIPSTKAPTNGTTEEDEIAALLAAAKKELVEEEVLSPAFSSSNPSELTADESALLNRSPNNFTLQVLASGSRSAVDDFIRRQPNRQDLAVFTANRSGKTLYIVVMGSFPSSNEARLAVETLPQEQKKAGPWPRTLQSVQAEIRQFRGF